MMTRKENDPPEEAHWEAVGWTEKVIGVLLVAGGVGINQVGNANGMGWLLVGVGVWMLLPSARPVISSLVNRLPGLPNKS